VSANLFFRILGLIVFGIIGWEIGTIWADTPVLNSTSFRYIVPSAAVGALIGALVAPFLTTRPASFVRQTVRQIPTAQLVAGIIGLAGGLLIAAILSVPLWRLPPPFGQIFPMVGAIVFGYLGITVMVLRQRDIFGLFGRRFIAATEETEEKPLLLDTSVIIDGRIADISRTGFIRGPMLVPRFVLNELQHIADSSDPLRRNRGRRGLEMLNQMQKEATVPVRIVDLDVGEGRQVDEKLIRAAKDLNCPIITNDYNLNRVAGLQGVTILNVNELANAVKPIVLPGEALRVHIIQEGKEAGQGVAYLDDGTMIVVDNGRRYLNMTIDVVVTKVLQTSAGRMIFAQPNGRNE
jgi:uncharacterized protein YacL